MFRYFLLLLGLLLGGPASEPLFAQNEPSDQWKSLTWRNVGPFRGGRSTAVCGVPGQDQHYYFGSTGGGLWETTDAGLNWKNISDGFFKTGSVGAVAVAESDPNVLYVGMGEHAVRGVMTSHGDGVYRSDDGGKTWKHLGLTQSRHIAAILIHPQDPNTLWVAVQGAVHGPGEERGIYKSTNGGQTWERTLFIDENTGACDLSIDRHNPRILYAGMWEHRRYPWNVKSGGPGSGLYKSVDGGTTWEPLRKGLPDAMGKVAIDVSPADPQVVYANIEAETGGVFRSDDGGASWRQTSKDRVTIARAWYYIEIFADPENAEVVYVLNAPMLRSSDGGKTFQSIANPHGDQHDLWINPDNPRNMILGNDGGACITFNTGKSWSSQENQPTAQFYRVITDHRFPYHLYGGQQDNTTMAIAGRTLDRGIDKQDWYRVSGGESAFLAFDPDDPTLVFGGSYQGNISVFNSRTGLVKDIMSYPVLGLGSVPAEMKYRFNWNAPIVAQKQDPSILYHAGNQVLRSADQGQSWQEISPDLTRNEKEKQGPGGGPYTNEAAGGENYNTISYLACSPHQAGIIWVGTDDGLVHLTMNEGAKWMPITPPDLGEALINCIEPSPHRQGTAYVVATRYKFNDFTPLIYRTDDYGDNWERITNGIGPEAYVRVVREDPRTPGLLYAGTETGLYVSFDGGKQWQAFQSNLPICPITDLTIQDNDLVAATSGRGFWILDDLSPLQQSTGKFDRLQLFSPKDTYKYNTDTGDRPPAGQGQNPAAGVILDYVIPNGSDTLHWTLEVIDEAGEIVRTFHNKKEKDFTTFPGGPPPLAVLPTKVGHNRFNWDLRRDRLPFVPGVFVMGDYRGHHVAPGVYRMRLFSDSLAVRASVQVLPDPRLEASPADHAEQQALLLEIEATVKKIHQTVYQMREVRQQVQDRLERLAGRDNTETVIQQGKDLIAQIDAYEAQLVQTKQKTFQDVINFGNRLSAELLNLKDRVDSLVPQPTAGARQRLQDLSKEWAASNAAFTQIVTVELAAFEKAYREAGFPLLLLPLMEEK